MTILDDHGYDLISVGEPHARYREIEPEPEPVWRTVLDLVCLIGLCLVVVFLISIADVRA